MSGAEQSVLSPYGPDAALIADLAWLLFVGGTAIFLFTMLCTGLSVWGGDRARRLLRSRRFILGAGAGFPIVVLSALLVHSLLVSDALGQRLAGEAPLRIEITGHQFWWEVRYLGLGPEGALVTANEIHIPVNREVELLVAAGDVYHALWVPSLHGKIDMVPGRVNRLRLRADRTGTLRGQCTEFCGTSHAFMAFHVVVQSAEGWQQWLERQLLPPAPPATAELALGREVFGAAGCGGCHAIRDTEWDGRLGPDLSQLGTRVSLAAGALANHRGTLAGWIAGTQDIKPGANMPAYNTVLNGPELRAVSAWLESLR